MDKKTLVIGASEKPDRYSNKAIHALRSKSHTVEALGNKNGIVEDVKIATEPMLLQDIDTVTLYLNPINQKPYYDYIFSLHPKRIIFNPGAENPELARLAAEKGIEPVYACTLVMLSIGTY